MGMSKWRQVRIDEIAGKNAKKGFIFLRLPEVPPVEMDATVNLIAAMLNGMIWSGA